MKLGTLVAILLLALAASLTLTASQAQTPSTPTAPAPTPTQSVAPVAASAPEQPVPFSHKQHAGALQLPCEFCHTPSRSGETVAIPQAAACMQCHQTMATSDPGVQNLASYAKTNATIPWVRVYQLPSFVSFSHKVHMEHGSTCQECHGQVAQRDRLYKETDISMAGCMNCHRAKKASLDCDTCHTLEQ
jgi:hypothetical protein